MRRYLFDTHTLLWYIQGAEQLPRAVLEATRQPAVTVYVSRVSLLETAIKYSIGKLQLRSSFEQWLHKTTASGFARLEIEDNHLAVLSALPLLPDHRDPFDRLLIAQALSEDLTLVSRDSKFAAYPGLRLQWA